MQFRGIVICFGVFTVIQIGGIYLVPAPHVKVIRRHCSVMWMLLVLMMLLMVMMGSSVGNVLWRWTSDSVSVKFISDSLLPSSQTNIDGLLNNPEMTSTEIVKYY